MTSLCESAGSGGREDFLALGCAVGQREFEVLGDQLLDVGAADSLGVGNLNNLEDLFGLLVHFP